ncbi:hypothetical protein PC123_g12052 [Phytophthora cactorum]|nr:hypothetical protein PC123_g12052 [Phytophthora cactorum]
MARDAHCQFVMEFASELMNGKWAEAPSEGCMVYGTRRLGHDIESDDGGDSSITPTRRSISCTNSPLRRCTVAASKQIQEE